MAKLGFPKFPPPPPKNRREGPPPLPLGLVPQTLPPPPLDSKSLVFPALYY